MIKYLNMTSEHNINDANVKLYIYYKKNNDHENMKYYLKNRYGTKTQSTGTNR